MNLPRLPKSAPNIQLPSLTVAPGQTIQFLLKLTLPLDSKLNEEAPSAWFITAEGKIPGQDGKCRGSQSDEPRHPSLSCVLSDLVMQYMVFRGDSFNSWSAKIEKSHTPGRLLFTLINTRCMILWLSAMNQVYVVYRLVFSSHTLKYLNKSETQVSF